MCKNLPFTPKYAEKPQKNTKFFCPLLDISVSGSPIIQDGKLVGAVTHVLVNDPTTGYGIFIENMLDAAAYRAIADRPYGFLRTTCRGELCSPACWQIFDGSS